MPPPYQPIGSEVLGSERRVGATTVADSMKHSRKQISTLWAVSVQIGCYRRSQQHITNAELSATLRVGAFREQPKPDICSCPAETGM